MSDQSFVEAFFTGSQGNRLAASVYAPAKTDTKPPVLFMHGGGQTRHSWHATALAVANGGRTAVTVDARGHGDSEWLEGGHYTFRHFADDLAALAPQVVANYGNGTEPCALVGASMGGVSAMVVQADADGPDIFGALVFVDITPRMTNDGVDKIMSFMAQNMREGFASAEDAADTIAAYLPGRKRPKSLSGLRKNLRKKADGRLYWHWDPAFVDGPHPVSSGYESSSTILIDSVKHITAPTMLVRGGKSELVTMEAVEEFMELVPHTEFVDVSGAGHMVAGDKNDAFSSAIVEFFARH